MIIFNYSDLAEIKAELESRLAKCPYEVFSGVEAYVQKVASDYYERGQKEAIDRHYSDRHHIVISAPK